MKIAETIQFIKKYRDLERATLQDAFTTFKSIFPDRETVVHLCETWATRVGDFGSFYLSLSWMTQFSLLAYMGLKDPDTEAFVKACEKDPVVGLLKDPPSFLQLPNDLLNFFLHHGIRRDCRPGIILPVLPTEDKRLGNSTNWGDYILSLPETIQQLLLKQIRDTLRPGI